MLKFQFFKILVSLSTGIVIFMGSDMAYANQEACDVVYGFSAAYSGATCMRVVDRDRDAGTSDWYYQPSTGSHELDLIIGKEMDKNIKISLKDKNIRTFQINTSTPRYDQGGYHSDENTGSIIHANIDLSTFYKDSSIESISDRNSYNYDTIHKKLITVDDLLSKKQIQKLTNNLKNDGRCTLLAENITKYSFINVDSAGKVINFILYPCIYREFSITVDYHTLMPFQDTNGCKIMKGYQYFDQIPKKRLADTIVCQKSSNTGIPKLDKAIDNKEKELIREYLQNDFSETYYFDHEVVGTGKIISVLLTISTNRGWNSMGYLRYKTFNYDKDTGKFVTLSQFLTKKQDLTATKQIIKFSEARSNTWSGDGKINPYSARSCAQSEYTESFTIHNDTKNKINAITFYNHCLVEMLPIKLSYPSLEVMDIDNLNKIPVFRHFFYGEKL